jgi:EmrB/QacA subfamily drug resistance transporter
MNKFMIPEAWRPWALLSAMSILVVLINIDYTAVNIALIPISHELEANLNTLQWLLSGYILTWAAAVVAAGQLADIFGKRRTLLLGLLLFAFASLWCGLAQSETFLITGRLIQGLGGALCVPPLFTLIFSVFPENKQGLAIGALGTGVGLGLAMGPTFGGAIVEYYNWRWIFLINVPLCLISLLITMMCVEKEPRRVSDHKFDLSGSLLLGASLLFIVYGINEMENWGLFSLSVWSVIGVGSALLAIFIYSSRNKSNRLIPFGLFSNKAFLGCIIGYTVVEVIFSIVLVTMGLYLQNVAGYSAYDSGIIFLSMTLAFGLFSPFGGRMVDHMDPRIPACLGIFFLLLGTTLALLFTTRGELHLIVPSFILVGIGLGIALPSFNAAMMKTVDNKILSTASGVFVMFANLGGSLGVVFGTSMLVGLGEPILTDMTHVYKMDLSSVQLDNLMTVYGSAYRELKLLTGMDVDLAVKLMNETFVQANWWVMLTGVILCLIAFAFSFYLIKIPVRQTENKTVTNAI